MFEEYKPVTPEQFIAMLKTNDMNVARFLFGRRREMFHPTRLALIDAVSAQPEYAASWIAYAMSYMAVSSDVTARDQAAFGSELETARKRIAHLEKENHNIRDDWNAAEQDLNAALSGLEAVDAALDALKHQIAVRVEDRAIAAALQAQIDLIQDMTGGVK
jgi:septal ring factor EnvC (AmiA/AmiB activator)